MAAVLDGRLRDRVAGISATLSEEAFEETVRGAVTALLRGYLGR